MADQSGRARREANLRKNLTHEEAVEQGRKGGLASAKAQKRKKTLREACQVLLTMEPTSDAAKEKLRKLGIDDDEMTNGMAMMITMFGKAIKGDVRAAQFIRDTMGESPSEISAQANLALHKAEFDYQKERDKVLDAQQAGRDIEGNSLVQIYIPDNGRGDTPRSPENGLNGQSNTKDGKTPDKPEISPRKPVKRAAKGNRTGKRKGADDAGTT